MVINHHNLVLFVYAEIGLHVRKLEIIKQYDSTLQTLTRTYLHGPVGVLQDGAQGRLPPRIHSLV